MSITATVQAGEVAPGHLGRIRTINGYETGEKCLQQLRRELFGDAHSATTMPAILVLAAVNRQDPMVYAQAHSFVPYRRAVAAMHVDVAHGSPQALWLLRKSGMKSPRDEALLCFECMKQDRAEHGFGYWHLQHQLPGMDTCLTHGQPLHRVRQRNAFDYVPHEKLLARRPTPAKRSASPRTSPLIQRYMEILLGLCARDRPLTTETVAGALASRANLYLRSGNCPQLKGPLTKLLWASAPRSWVLAHFPRCASKGAEPHESPLDWLLNPRYRSSAANYALAAALLFTSSTEALSHLDAPTVALPGRVVA